MIRPVSHLRNVLVATLVILLVLIGSQLPRQMAPLLLTSAAPLQQTPTFSFDTNPVTVLVGSSVTARATLTNTGSVTETYTLTTTNGTSFPGWSFSFSPTITVPPTSSVAVDFLINAPTNASGNITLNAEATGQNSGATTPTSLVINVSQIVPTPTQTPSVTSTPAPSSFTFTFADSTVEVEPGGRVTASAILTNTSQTSGPIETYTITTNIADFPGWSVNIFPGETISNLAPGAAENLDFRVGAPTTATTDIDLTVTITAQSNGRTFNALLSVALPTPTPTNTNTPSPTNTPEPGNVAVLLTVRSDDEQEGTPGQDVEYDLRVQNTGEDEATITLRVSRSCNEDIEDCSDQLTRSSITLNGNASADLTLRVALPRGAQPGAVATTRVEAFVTDNIRDEVSVRTTVIAPTATPTETPTPSNTPTNTPTLGPVCADIFENDDDLGSAKDIFVDLPQPQPTRDPDFDDRRAICPSGDEDWLVFGGIAGKVYTIDVRDVVPGLDLTLELFDEEGTSLAFNDDFFDRNPAEPNASDIDPRIDEWRAPSTQRYYIRVRDATDRGGVDRTYTIEVISESYGPTPQTVVEVCEDLFEPDGLPEQAQLITSNELQRERRLCPTGDADWVTFFGSQGKRYFIYTNTRPYFNNNPVNDVVDVEAGADTVLVLTDRDGVSVIDVNDDIPGGETLDSQIEFVPEVDGFYFAQVKNVGDIGNQFIRYDLTLELCVPGVDDCGRNISLAAGSAPTVPVGPALPTSTTAAPLLEPTMEPTSETNPTDTATNEASERATSEGTTSQDTGT